jgi:acetyl-CoA C-acetyltransferase
MIGVIEAAGMIDGRGRDLALVGGVESMSKVQVGASIAFSDWLKGFQSARTVGQKLAHLARLKASDLKLWIPKVANRTTGLSMGEHTEITAKAWKLSRADQDQIAFESHQHAVAAWEAGFFDDLVTPYLGVTRDTILRPDTSVEKLAALKPVFGDTMTAGNSTALTDGAAVVLVAEQAWAEANGLPLLARFVDAQVAAVDHASGDDLLLAPAHAASRLLARQGMGLGDFELYELHEAFASTVLATLAAWESAAFCREQLGLPAALGRIDRSRLNVTGSSLAAGHPFAATGGRIVATLAKLLHERGPGARGLVSICAAGGQGVVAILEAV